jgi:hypothetical protein
MFDFKSVVDVFARHLRLGRADQAVLEREFARINQTSQAVSQSRGPGPAVASGPVYVANAALEDGLKVWSPDGKLTFIAEPDGDVKVGWDVLSAAGTALAVYSVAQDYNGETLGRGDLVLGDTTPGKANLQWDRSAGSILLRSGKVGRISLAADGDVKIGPDVSAPGTTNLAIFSSDQAYNGEQVAIGDMLIGDSSPGKANLFWDKSEGRLKFRGGKTVTAYVDTDGKLFALAGEIGGWTIAPGLLSSPGILLNSAESIINVGGTSPYLEINGATKQIKASSFVPGKAGFRLSGLTGDAEFNNITARGEIRASVFTIGEVQAHAGTLGIFNSAAVLYEGFTSPAVSGNVEIKVKKTASGNPPFSYNANADLRSRLLIKYWDATNGLITAWLRVDAAGIDAGDYYRYPTCRMMSGSSFVQFPAGIAIADYGPKGSGNILLCAYDPSGNTPNLSMSAHEGEPWISQIEMLRTGNLRNTFDYPDSNIYGTTLGRKEHVALTLDTGDLAGVGANGLRIWNNNAVIAQWDASGKIIIGEYGRGKSRIEISSGAFDLVRRNYADDTEYNWIHMGTDGLAVFGPTRDNYARVEIRNTGLYLLSRVGGQDYERIKLGSDGNAEFTGKITATSGEIAGNLSVTGSGRILAGGGLVELSADGLNLSDQFQDGSLPSSIYWGNSVYLQGYKGGLSPNRYSILQVVANADRLAARDKSNITLTANATDPARDTGIRIYSNVNSPDYSEITFEVGGDGIANFGKDLITFHDPLMVEGAITTTSDIYTTPWTDYSSSSTVVGWSSFTTKIIHYKKVGKLVFVNYNIQGTSNATTASFTLPFTPATYTVFPVGRAVDNGVYVNTHPFGHTETGKWSFYLSANGSEAWTASGTKMIRGQFFFEEA